MAVIWNTSRKNAYLEQETSNQGCFNFIVLIYIGFRDMQSFFEFLVSVIYHYHIDAMHLFWDSFERFCLQISSGAKYFPSLVQGIVIKD